MEHGGEEVLDASQGLPQRVTMGGKGQTQMVRRSEGAARHDDDTRAVEEPGGEVGVAAAGHRSKDIVDAGKQLVARHPDVGAIVLECTNMPPYAAALQAEVGLPVYDIYSMIQWFQAGLRPRIFDRS